MPILFLGNTPADVGLSPGVASVAATGRDAAYSPSSLLCKNVNPSIAIPVHGGTSIWIHYRMFLNNCGTGNGVGSGPVLRLFDVASAVIMDIQKGTNDHDCTMRVYGSSTVSSAETIIMTDKEYIYDIKVTVGGSGGTIVVEWFINGALWASVTATNSGTVKTQPRTLSLEFPSQFSAGATGINYSEIIIAVDEPTIGMRLATLQPTSAGALAAWTGTVASLADSDGATGIQSVAAAQRFSSILSAYAGPSSPAGIRSVTLKALASQSGLAPQQIDQFFRIASTNYDSALVTPSPGVPLYREAVNDPATGLPWLVAALAALEIGFRSGT